MAIDTTETEESIITQLKTVVQRVYVTEHPNPQSPVYPYIIVYFGSPIAITTDRHITSVINDSQVGYVTVQIVSETDKISRDVHNAVRKALIGFTPTDSGQMRPGGGMAYSRSANNARPVLYYRESTYLYNTNLSWNDLPEE